MGGCPRIWRITTGTIDQAAEVQQQNLARIRDLYPVGGTARHSCLRSIALSRQRAVWSPYGTSISISSKKERPAGLQIEAEPGEQGGRQLVKECVSSAGNRGHGAVLWNLSPSTCINCPIAWLPQLSRRRSSPVEDGGEAATHCPESAAFSHDITGSINPSLFTLADCARKQQEITQFLFSPDNFPSEHKWTHTMLA
jgi:hypothetical protein